MQGPPSSHTVLIRARCLTGYVAVVEQHGGDAGALLGEVGIPRSMLEAPDSPLPMPGMLALLNESARHLGQADFGLQLGGQQDVDVLGAVAVIAHHSVNVGEALLAIARNLRYVTPGVQLTLESDPLRTGYTRLRIDVNPGTEQPRRHAVELCFGMAQRFLKMTTQDPGQDWHITFRHDSPLTEQQYGQHFKGKVVLNQNIDSLSLPSRLMLAPIAPDGAALLAAAERHVGNLMRRFPLDLAQQVEALVERQLAAGGGQLVEVARQLGLHERTLQRRLKDQCLFFEDIVDHLRRSRAERYLAYPAIPLAQVAAMLGYTEQSSFIRGCKRWFATTPQGFRDRCAR